MSEHYKHGGVYTANSGHPGAAENSTASGHGSGGSSQGHTHSEIHFTNVSYGYYILAVSGVYLVLLFFLRRIILQRRAAQPGLVRRLYSVDPLLHMTILCIPIGILFYRPEFNFFFVYAMKFGRLSYALIPLDLVLALRPNFLYSKNYTYTDFIPIHKWLSRFIGLAAFIHAVIFAVHWAKAGTLISSSLKLANFYGIVIMFLMCLMILLSIRPLRRWSYKLFYVSHNIANLSLIFMTPLHARPGVGIPYFVINCALLAIIGFYKFYYTSRTEFTSVLQVTKSDLRKNSSLIALQLPRSSLPAIFAPGAHIRLSYYSRYNPLYWLLPTHPYTVVSLPGDPIAELIVLENRNNGAFKFVLDQKYTVLTHYDPAVPSTCFSNGKRISIVCGGTGIAFGLPIFRYFAKQRSSSESNLEYLNLLWMVKTKEEVEVLDKLQSLSGLWQDKSTSSKFHIFITQYTDQATDSTTNEYELETFGESSEMLEETFLTKTHLGSINFGRRMDWDIDLTQFVQESSLDHTWLLSCGPKSLVKSAEKYAADNNINFASEVFDT